jgi:hypothetical protein
VAPAPPTSAGSLPALEPEALERSLPEAAVPEQPLTRKRAGKSAWRGSMLLLLASVQNRESGSALAENCLELLASRPRAG